MKIDPIEIEQLFAKISADISRAGSERVQLLYHHQFLKALHGSYLEYDSYLIQLFEVFPSLKHPLLFTGFRPDDLEAIIQKCEEAVKAIPELQDEKSIQQKMDLLLTGHNHIKSWLGIKEEGGGEGNLQVISISGKEYRKAENLPGEVFIPVVETSEGFTKKGRLRKLKVELVGKSGKGEFELRPVFGVIGANTGNLGETPGKAAGNLLRESIENSNYWSGTASFELSHTWHAGSSANLALSSLFYCEMLKAEKKREYFQLNPGIAITGDIDKLGNVLAVDKETLLQKTEAAFFSWAQVLVVPVQHLEKATEYLEELQQEFPNRNLVIKGISHLREMFFDRRLTLHKKTSLIEHTVKRVWRRRYRTAVTILFLILIGVIGGLIYGPIDKNPVSVSYAGDYLVLENASGVEVGRVNVGEKTIEIMEQDGSAVPKAILHDINGDRRNELFWSKQIENNNKSRTFVQAWSISGDSVIWEQSMMLNYEFPRQHVDMSGYLQISELSIVKIYESEKLLVNGAINTFFPNVLSLLDLKTGEIEQEYLHVGKIYDITTLDLDKDGKEEILLTGVNNAFWQASLMILDPENLHGHSPLTEDYQVENIPKAKEMYYILIPKTEVGKYLTRIEKFNKGRAFYLNKDAKNISVRVLETTRSFGSNTERATIFTYLDYNMKPIGFGTSDLYDIIARELYEDGHIPFIPDYDYFESLKDSLLYWNGEEFVNEPSMNREYLDVVGERED